MHRHAVSDGTHPSTVIDPPTGIEFPSEHDCTPHAASAERRAEPVSDGR
ncbi:MAG: hypothetical protein LC798_18970 [Chloroflexi bacterium]|nr:hypothetical protein [Chloroflexota bacterium]